MTAKRINSKGYPDLHLCIRADCLSAGIDGTGCPVMKEETEGRKGKQPDGSAKTREVKVFDTFSVDGVNSIIALHCSILSGSFDNFMSERKKYAYITKLSCTLEF